MKAVFAAVLLLLVAWCEGYPSGAPSTACVDLLPRHKVRNEKNEKLENIYEAQRSNSPYRIEISPKNAQPGGLLNFTIKGEDSFQGFFLRVYDSQSNKPVSGQFRPTDGAHPVKCDADKDSITQNGKEEKRDLKVTWEVPSSLKGPVNLYVGATILQNFRTFWRINSDSFSVK
ncbi:putative defense protein [Centruroides vittatus]|uniref:putative defense protein n=1 Tax=Centruroides vittatus TaxID=120091 RepID=UPI0035107457